MPYTPGSGGGGQPENKNAEKWTEEKALELGNELLEWIQVEPEYIMSEKGNSTVRKVNMFIWEFLLKKNLDTCTVSYLAKKFKSFSIVLTKSKHFQELRLNKLGLLKGLDPGLVKFNLINHHGYKDKYDFSHSKLEEAEKLKFEW